MDTNCKSTWFFDSSRFCFFRPAGVELPESLQSLTFGRYWSHSLEHMLWPPCLQQLTFGDLSELARHENMLTNKHHANSAWS